jgi:hypothetical protein
MSWYTYSPPRLEPFLLTNVVYFFSYLEGMPTTLISVLVS